MSQGRQPEKSSDGAVGDGRAVFIDGLNEEEAQLAVRDEALGWKSWRRRLARLIEGE